MLPQMGSALPLVIFDLNICTEDVHPVCCWYWVPVFLCFIGDRMSTLTPPKPLIIVLNLVDTTTPHTGSCPLQPDTLDLFNLFGETSSRVKLIRCPHEVDCQLYVCHCSKDLDFVSHAENCRMHWNTVWLQCCQRFHLRDEILNRDLKTS